MLDADKKAKIIKKFRTHDKDTGSPEVQIAILTEEVKLLTEHLREHRHDFSSRRGLIKKVNQRRSLLRYLSRENADSYAELTKKLKLKEFKKIKVDADEVMADQDAADTEKTEAAK
jgi:small subunit ribosomal protein S15